MFPAALGFEYKQNVLCEKVYFNCIHSLAIHILNRLHACSYNYI